MVANRIQIYPKVQIGVHRELYTTQCRDPCYTSILFLLIFRGILSLFVPFKVISFFAGSQRLIVCKFCHSAIFSLFFLYFSLFCILFVCLAVCIHCIIYLNSLYPCLIVSVAAQIKFTLTSGIATCFLYCLVLYRIRKLVFLARRITFLKELIEGRTVGLVEQISRFKINSAKTDSGS